MPEKFDVVTIGDCQLDHFVRLDNYSVVWGQGTQLPKLELGYSQKIPVKEFLIFQGGNALNTAVSFSRLGLKTAVHAFLGADEGAATIMEKLKSEGISTRFIKQDRRTETDKSVIIVTGGERTILTYHCKKNYLLAPKLDTEWVYLTSLGQGHEPIYKGVRNMIKKGLVKASFNPGTRQLKDDIKGVRDMIKDVDLLFVNLQEAQIINASREEDKKKHLNALRALGAKCAVVTDGVKGAYAFDGHQYLKAGSYPAKKLDATGAGDAFSSAFTAAVILGQSISEALVWGSVMAASEIAQVGVQNGLYNKSQLLQTLKKSPHFVAKIF